MNKSFQDMYIGLTREVRALKDEKTKAQNLLRVQKQNVGTVSFTISYQNYSINPNRVAVITATNSNGDEMLGMLTFNSFDGQHMFVIERTIAGSGKLQWKVIPYISSLTPEEMTDIYNGNPMGISTTLSVSTTSKANVSISYEGWS